MFPRFVTIAAVLSLVLVVPSLICSVVWWLLGYYGWDHLGNGGLLVGFGLAVAGLGNLNRDGSRYLRAILWSCLVLHVLGILAMFVLVGSSPVVHHSHLGTTFSHLKQITEAMQAHAEEHDNRFPPAALRSNTGKPLLSWRVVLLPYLGEEALYKKFRLDEPWDSDDNLALLDHMPKVYGTAYPDRIPPYTTRFQVFVGPGSPFEVEKGPRDPDDFPDGLWDTVLVAEARHPVPWTKPVDLVYSPDAPVPELGPGRDETRWQWYRTDPNRFGLAFASGRIMIADYRSATEERLRFVIVRNDGKGWIEEP